VAWNANNYSGWIQFSFPKPIALEGVALGGLPSTRASLQEVDKTQMPRRRGPASCRRSLSSVLRSSSAPWRRSVPGPSNHPSARLSAHLRPRKGPSPSRSVPRAAPSSTPTRAVHDTRAIFSPRYRRPVTPCGAVLVSSMRYPRRRPMAHVRISISTRMVSTRTLYSRSPGRLAPFRSLASAAGRTPYASRAPRRSTSRGRRPA
jgi:hypothetical protein